MGRFFVRLAGLLAVVFVVTAAGGSGAARTRPAFLVIAFSSSNAPSDTRIVAHTFDRAGELLHTVTASGATTMSWSPDGSRLAFADQDGLWIERADGTGRRRLLKTRTTCTSICLSTPTAVWSPDGKTLAVGGVDPITTGFVRIDVSSGRASPLRIAKRGTRYIPIAFSPNGKLLAYATNKNTADEELIVSDANGSKPRVMHQFHDLHDGPGVATWSPDSTRLAFTDDGRDPRDPRFAVVDVRSAKLHAIAAPSVFDQSPAWSPDGTRLAVGQFKGQAFTVSADGTDLHPLGIAASGALWLRNGDLVLARGANGHNFAILSAAQGKPRMLFTLPYREVLYAPLQEAK